MSCWAASGLRRALRCFKSLIVFLSSTAHEWTASLLRVKSSRSVLTAVNEVIREWTWTLVPMILKSITETAFLFLPHHWAHNPNKSAVAASNKRLTFSSTLSNRFVISSSSIRSNSAHTSGMICGASRFWVVRFIRHIPCKISDNMRRTFTFATTT